VDRAHVTYNQHFPYRWKDLIEWRKRKSDPALADRWEWCNRRGLAYRNNRQCLTDRWLFIAGPKCLYY